MHRLTPLFVLAFFLVMVPESGWAQEDHGDTSEFTAPPTWKVRLDRPDRGSVEDIWYVDMPPGWHVTTGPAGIFWDPANHAHGTFRIESESYLFDPGERREAYGFFFGGSDLEGEAQLYTYFLIREGGEFLVKSRTGDDTEVVVNWTAHPAIVSYATKAEDANTAKNILAVEVEEGLARFFVNGAEVATVPSRDIRTDGLVGLRVNHSVNVHVTSLDITAR